MYKIGINFDEISDSLDEAIGVMRRQKVMYGELRTLNKKNFVFWTDLEVRDFKARIDASGIILVAAATPLFKWYDKETDPEVVHDNFGFNPRLSFEEKKKVIDRVLHIADSLAISRLRIFSGLGHRVAAGKHFADSDLLSYALTQADSHNISLYIENEPVCNVHTKSDILDLLKYNSHPRLNLWLDIANLIEIGEDLDPEFIKSVAGRLGYVHVKDFLINDGEKIYVPVGKGKIIYDRAIRLIYDEKQDGIIITVETHAKTDKISMSEQSIIGLRRILDEQGITHQ